LFVVSLVLMVPVLGVLGGATSPVVLGMAITVLIALSAGGGPPVFTYLAELFPVAARFTGANIGNQLASSVGGGTAPLVASALVLALASPFAPLVVLVTAGVVAVTAVLVAPRFLRDTQSPLYGSTAPASPAGVRPRDPGPQVPVS
jgi:MHS family proline/betaine transporter-like MFS transporter